VTENPLDPGRIPEDGLPYPQVHYPAFEGVFLAFGLTPDDPPTFCACAQPAPRSAWPAAAGGAAPVTASSRSALGFCSSRHRLWTMPERCS